MHVIKTHSSAIMGYMHFICDSLAWKNLLFQRYLQVAAMQIHSLGKSRSNSNIIKHAGVKFKVIK